MARKTKQNYIHTIYIFKVFTFTKQNSCRMLNDKEILGSEMLENQAEHGNAKWEKIHIPMYIYIYMFVYTSTSMQ